MMIFSGIIEKCVWSVRSVGVSLGTQEPCTPPDVATRVNLCPKAHTGQFLLLLTHCHGCEGAFSSAQAAGAA